MSAAHLHLDEVATTYAKSLYQLAMSHGGQETARNIGEELLAIRSMLDDGKLREFFASRIVSSTDRGATLKKVLAGRISDRTAHFIQLLNDKGRLGHLGRIVQAYDNMVQEALGRVEVIVTSAQPLSADELAGLKANIAAKLSREPVMTTRVDPTLLGGLRLQIGDRLVDASLQSRLRSITQSLAENGLPAIRGAADRVFSNLN